MEKLTAKHVVKIGLMAISGNPKAKKIIKEMTKGLKAEENRLRSRGLSDAKIAKKLYGDEHFPLNFTLPKELTEGKM